MASYMLNGAENLLLIKTTAPSGLAFARSSVHGKRFANMGFVSKGRDYKFGRTRSQTVRCTSSVSSSKPASQPRFIQHKKETFWFYRFLSIVYDHVIKSGHWTEDMREEALEPADLSDRNMIVVDVGGWTGFTTLGIVKKVDAMGHHIMASYMLNGAENLLLIKTTVPNGLAFARSSLHGKRFANMGFVSKGRDYKFGRTRSQTVRCTSSVSSSRPASQPRFIQHIKEAFWFYRFLSIVYDHVINSGHWTEDMREEALEPADPSDRNMIVVDVGGWTGFTTLAIVKKVDAKNVTILDQSPHQLAKAREKAALKECKIIEGDAEDLPFPTDYADRYVSTGR